MAESEEERILDDMSATIRPQDIHHFSFPTYKSPDTKDDMVSSLVSCLCIFVARNKVNPDE